jgi:hypothetical protein
MFLTIENIQIADCVRTASLAHPKAERLLVVADSIGERNT